MLFGQVGICEGMATIEHVTPRWRGGSNELENLVLAHGRCNHRRNEADQKQQGKFAMKNKIIKSPEEVALETYNGGLVSVPDPDSSRGYTIRYDPVGAMRAALAAAREIQLDRLRRILHRYGDRVPMAMRHRSDWQCEIDDALEWVANNPETTAPGGSPASGE